MAKKFLSDIELDAGLVDVNGNTGTSGQILSSTGSATDWIDQNTITSSSDFVFFDVKNETGSTILKGKGVMAVGTDGNSGHILIDEMVADGSVESKYFLGVLEEDIANGGFARVISFGQLSQFDTRGQNGETWADGQVLWCDPANNGDFTITEPDGPNVKIAAAFILNSSTNGKIQVRVQANEGIHDLHDTKITSQLDGDVLVWDNNTGVWFNDSTLNVDYANSRVGIGTTSPEKDLHIKNSGYPFIKMQSEGYYPGFEMQFTKGASTNEGRISLYRNPGANSFKFQKYNNGSPNSRLELKPNQVELFTNYTYQAGLLATNTAVSIYSNYSTAIRINASAQVGIGTTSPTERLVVNGSINSQFQSGNFAAGNKRFFADGYADGNLARMGALSGASTDPMELAIYTSASGSSGGAERMRIDSSGNVGIGTTNPGYKLDVAGDLRVDNGNVGSTSGDEVEHVKIQGARHFLKFKEVRTANDSDWRNTTFKIQTGVDSTNHQSIDFVADGSYLEHIDIRTGNQVFNTRFTSSGNVGIGTTSPSGRLTIGSGVTTDNSTMFNVNGQYNDVGFNGGTSGLLTQGVWSFINSATWDQTRFYVQDQNNSNSRLTFDFKGNGGNINILAGTSSGKVGIGTTSPVANLHVSSGTANEDCLVIIESDTDNNDETSNPRLELRQDGGGVIGRLGYRDNTNSLELINQFAESLYLGTDNSIDLTILSNGNVGIGTTSPSQKLDVVGNAQITSDIHLGRYILHDGDGNTWLGFPSADTISFRTNGSDRMYINSSGNVGIGTTSPDSKLHVKEGDITIEGFNTSRYLRFIEPDGSFQGGYVNYDGASNILKIGVHNANDTNTANDTDAISIPRSSGNVGIGTTNPGEKLEVNGTVKATASTDAYKGYIKNTITCTPLMKTANTNYNYIPYNSTIFGSTPDYYNRMAAAYDGRVKKIILRHISGTTPTATGMKFKKEVNGTVSTTEYTATVTGGASASFTAIYNFANSDFTFSEGDSIGILAQTSGGTGNISGASVQIILEYNIT
jgi:hypothetical protein